MLLDLRIHIWGASLDLQTRRFDPRMMHKASYTVQHCLPYKHRCKQKQPPKDQTLEEEVHE
ncbi:hypothetical protein D3C81_1377710 [compost metagenome]